MALPLVAACSDYAGDNLLSAGKIPIPVYEAGPIPTFDGSFDAGDAGDGGDAALDTGIDTGATSDAAPDVVTDTGADTGSSGEAAAD